MRQYDPGDILTAVPVSERTYYVYELIDDDACIFYVGMSHDPRARFAAHLAKIGRSTTTSARRICERVRACEKPVMRIVSAHQSKVAALAAENEHARSFHPGCLLNSIIPGYYSAQWPYFGIGAHQ